MASLFIVTVPKWVHSKYLIMNNRCSQEFSARHRRTTAQTWPSLESLLADSRVRLISDTYAGGILSGSGIIITRFRSCLGRGQIPFLTLQPKEDSKPSIPTRGLPFPLAPSGAQFSVTPWIALLGKLKQNGNGPHTLYLRWG